MKSLVYFLIYLVLYIIGFTLLERAHVLDFDNTSKTEFTAKFIIMLIVLIAVTRCGVKAYKLLTDKK